MNYRLHKFVKTKKVLREIYFINCWYIIASNILCWTLYLRPLFLQQFGFYMSQKQQVNIIMRAFVGLFSSLIQNLNFVLNLKKGIDSEYSMRATFFI